MRYLVYHSKDIIDMVRRLGPAPEEINLKNYDLVAMVESETLDDVFRITNHIDTSWWNNPEVIMAYNEVRSTSVGDVAVELESHKAHMVMGIGWEEVKLCSD